MRSILDRNEVKKMDIMNIPSEKEIVRKMYHELLKMIGRFSNKESYQVTDELLNAFARASTALTILWTILAGEDDM